MIVQNYHFPVKLQALEASFFIVYAKAKQL